MSTLLLALDSKGFPARWLTWQEAIAQEVLGKVTSAFGDFEFTFHGGRNKDSGVDSEITLKSILVLKGHSPVRSPYQTIPLTNAALFRRDRYTCAYCGHVGAKGLTRDHIVPLSKGGVDRWLNVCACCVLCNSKKGSHSLERLGWELLFVPYAPTHNEGLILQNRQILVDQMEFLTTLLPKHSRFRDA